MFTYPWAVVHLSAVQHGARRIVVADSCTRLQLSQRMWANAVLGAVMQLMHTPTYGLLRWMSAAPCSAYSCRDSHSWWNDPRQPRMDPPSHTANLRSVVLWFIDTLTFAACGARSSSSRSSRSFVDGNRQPPPAANSVVTCW